MSLGGDGGDPPSQSDAIKANLRFPTWPRGTPRTLDSARAARAADFLLDGERYRPLLEFGVVGSPLASLRIVNFERNVTPELLGRPNEPGKPWFSRGGVAVWKVADAGTEFIGPRGSVLDDSEDLLAVTAIHVSRQSPLLSLTSSRHLTTLRKFEGKFEIAEELSMAPAP